MCFVIKLPQRIESSVQDDTDNPVIDALVSRNALTETNMSPIASSRLAVPACRTGEESASYLLGFQTNGSAMQYATCKFVGSSLIHRAACRGTSAIIIEHVYGVYVDFRSYRSVVGDARLCGIHGWQRGNAR
jgi:hypothetical protein